ncbi:TetR/AcrR family transcriptional regulator [Dermacoccus nishinomiyaensis]|uniref:TetR/AcrR family transcriptional regulator n=1 Tax=Dermacoccus nishinomiyaensis TaxID=1274 RepID=UPI0028A03F7E|nr:TetR/AcrR family transcriptional regulator [Dermacoccus nishinomiyaensis]
MSTTTRASSAQPDGRDARWAAHRVARRRELVDAALRAIRRHGAGVGMDEIAAEAGTSKTVIYRHLGDRLGLYLAVCESVDALILAEIDVAASATSDGDGDARATGSSARRTPGPAMLGAVIDSYLRLVERDPEVYRFVVRRPDVTLPEGPGDPVTGLSGRIADNLFDLLLAFGPDTEEARGRARAFAWGVVGLVKESADRWLENPGGLSRAQLAAHLAALAHGGLAGALARDAPALADAHIATDGPGGVDQPDRPADTGRDERSIHDDTARSDETPTFDPAG